MASSSARTLATLDAFLESQRQLLSRTQSDLHRLAALREHALAHPEEFVEDIEETLDDPAFKMSEYDVPTVPEDIDWSLFASLDPSGFSDLHVPGPPPLVEATKQLSPPSELQNFVRQAAKDILGDFRPYVPPDDDSSQDTEEAANEQRLAELVNTNRPDIINGAPPTASKPRRRVGSGLRLKHENEALASTWGLKEQGKGGQKDLPSENSPHVRLRSQRLRKPTTRADEVYPITSPTVMSPKLSDAHPLSSKLQTPSPTEDTTPSQGLDYNMDTSELATEVTPQQSDAKKQEAKPRKRGAPSETFNLPWTPEEQNHLERLLEEIPAGEKNRWAKISKAMSGKRTPRQVASRVQKYFEKLRKFGVEPG